MQPLIGDARFDALASSPKRTGRSGPMRGSAHTSLMKERRTSFDYRSGALCRHEGLANDVFLGR